MGRNAGLKLTDNNGVERTIDINPINREQSGTIDEHLGQVYHQTAYNGSPTDHDGFSNDYIGTGEGNQTHGYGMYFAKNKDVSEGYRKYLAGVNEQDMFNPIPVNVYYDGKHATELDFEMTADLSLALEKVGNEGKKAGIDYLQNEIDKCQEEVDEFEKGIEKSPADEPAYRQQIENAQFYINDYKKQIDFIKKLDLDKLEVEKRNVGQLFEVDIPEDDVMLDEDKPLSEQPEKVRKAIFEYMKKNPDDFILPKDYNSLGNMTGKQFYKEVSLIERRKGAEGSGQKEASETLNKLGIEGIKYNGRQDGECYVVFNDKAIKILKKYYQEGDQQNYFRNGMSGTFVGNQDAIDKLYKGEYVPFRRVIKIFESGDESTIIHEFAHWYLDALDKYSQDNEELQQDMEQVRKFLKNDGGAFTVAQHEKFARAFEVINCLCKVYILDCPPTWGTAGGAIIYY